MSQLIDRTVNANFDEEGGQLYPESPPVSNSKEESSKTIPSDPDSDLIVWWDEPEGRDPKNPMNWSSKAKWVNIVTISVISFLV